MFLGTNIEEKQEDVVAEAIESGISDAQFDAEMDARAEKTALTEDDDYAALESFFEMAQERVPQTSATEPRPSAFADTFAFTTAALKRVQEMKKNLDFTTDENDRVVTLVVPDDFRERTLFGAATRKAVQPRFMPPEA